MVGIKEAAFHIATGFYSFAAGCQSYQTGRSIIGIK